MAAEPDPPLPGQPPLPRAAAGPARVVVLGMHRSGTSALTRVLGLMGCWVGGEEELLAADRDNPTGYWEHKGVNALDRDVLAGLGAAWWRGPGPEVPRLAAAARQAHEERARQVVAGLDRHAPWAIKDPRLCVLFDLWRPVLGRPSCVIAYRHPLAVARSLEARDAVPLPYGVALWERYTREALASSAGLPRLAVSYHRLMAQPEAEAERLRAFLPGLGLPERDALRAFLAPDLDHHRVDRGDAEGLLTVSQARLLDDLESGAALEPGREAGPLSTLARELLASPHLAERGSWGEGAVEERARVDGWIDALLELVEAFLRSRWWRAGSGLRRAARALLRRPPVPGVAEKRDAVLREVQAWRATPRRGRQLGQAG